MTTITARPTTLLRRALLLDGVASGGLGVLLTVAAGPLAGVLGGPDTLHRTVGIVLIVYGAAVLYLGTRPMISRPAAATVVVLNCGWVLASAAVAVADPWSLTALGVAFVVAQALVVAGLAALQFAGLRQLGGASR